MIVNEVKSVADLRERTSDKTTNDGAYEVQAVALANADIIVGLQVHFINNVDYEMGMQDGSINISSTGNGVSAKDIGKMLGILDGKTNFAMKTSLEDIMFMIMLTTTQAIDDQRASRSESAIINRNIAYKAAYTTFKLKQMTAKKEYEITEKEVKKEIKNATRDIIMAGISIGISVISVATEAISGVMKAIKSVSDVVSVAGTAKDAAGTAKDAADAVKDAGTTMVAGDTKIAVKELAKEGGKEITERSGKLGSFASKVSKLIHKSGIAKAKAFVKEVKEQVLKGVTIIKDELDDIADQAIDSAEFTKRIEAKLKDAKATAEMAEKNLGDASEKMHKLEEAAKKLQDTIGAAGGAAPKDLQDKLNKVTTNLKKVQENVKKLEGELKSFNEKVEAWEKVATNDMCDKIFSLKKSEKLIDSGDAVERNAALWTSKGKHGFGTDTDKYQAFLELGEATKKVTYQKVRMNQLEKVFGAANTVSSAIGTASEFTRNAMDLANIKISKQIAQLRKETSVVQANVSVQEQFFNNVMQRTKEMQDAYLKSKKAVNSVLDSLNMMQQQIQSTRLSLAIKI